jgi:serine phosphatase RsbU (regulator of sigma subunit)
MRLQGKIVLTMLLPLAGIMAMVVRQDLQSTRLRAIDEGSTRLQDAVQNAATLFDGQFRRVAQVADTAAIAVQDYRDWDPEELFRLAHAIVARDPVILGFGMTWEPGLFDDAPDGFMPFAERRDSGIEESDIANNPEESIRMSEMFDRLRRTRDPYWSLAFRVGTPDTDGADVVRYLSPIRQEGRLLGAATVDIGASAFKDIAHRIGLSGRQWLLMDRSGRGIVAQTDAARRLTGRDSIRDVDLDEIFRLSDADGLDGMGDIDAMLASVDRGKTVVTIVEPIDASIPDVDLGRRVAAITRIDATGWILVMGEPIGVLTDPADRLVRTRALRAGLLALTALGVVVLGAWRAVLRPTRRIVEAVEQAAAGDVTARANLAGTDELAVLGRAIDEAIPRMQELATTRVSLESARQVQQAMLPTGDLVTDRACVSGQVRPSDETGGDYFDHAIFENGSVVFGLGDATGHGLPSALFATTARAYVRAMLRREQALDPAIAEANDLLVDDARGGLFMVLFVAAWSPEDAVLRVGSAGHPGWLLRHDDHAYRILEAPGVPLGIAKDQRFGTAAVENVRGGDLVLVASDGAWEVRNPGGEQLGTEALLRQAAAIRGLPPDEQVARLFEFITDFADGRPLDDDCTIVIARFD